MTLVILDLKMIINASLRLFINCSFSSLFLKVSLFAPAAASAAPVAATTALFSAAFAAAVSAGEPSAAGDGDRGGHDRQRLARLQPGDGLGA